MNEKLVTVARFSNNIDADLAKQLLEDEGIQVFLMGQNAGILWGAPSVGEIELQTPESQVEEARQILEASEQEKRERGEDAEFGQEEELEDEPDLDPAPEDEQE
jgi:hypothetical protein